MKIKKEIIRYLTVTPFIGAADFGTYFSLIHFLPHSVSKAISYIIANGIGYAFNKYWIFKKKKSSVPEAGRYFILDVFLFGCNIITNQAILHVWPKAVFWAVAGASLLTASLSFICKKWWVFKASTV